MALLIVKGRSCRPEQTAHDEGEHESHVAEEVQDCRVGNTTTSIGMRLAFWKKSIEFIAAAPLLGPGTGTIKALFQRKASNESGTSAVITGNPHNQILAVAIPLGTNGAVVLIAMWIAHLALFRDATSMSWFGVIVVVSNVVSSLFNTHLFDFTQGWLYVFRVGIIGGAVLRQRNDINVGVQHYVAPAEIDHTARGSAT